ncbi:protein-methionine-sulfoxide reductase catalytic subunit MsrP [Arenimonas sp.]|uniref:protein-methionine-sulfoxide reductase catalytic subunit MsrP n=1 Tax=Arenimonas sp. TaxID=1872635 RepID=UPI0039E41378
MSQKYDPDILASEITTESVYQSRRRLLRAGLGSPLLLLAGCGPRDADAGASPIVTTSAKDSPDGFRTSESQTRFEDASSYNNFYEFGTGKADPARYAGSLRPSPWRVDIAGEAEVTGRFNLEDLLKGVAPQERIYRMRCVEGWSMVIPWLGLPLGDVLRKFKPTSRAKYVAFTSLADPRQMPGVSYDVLDWPYREGLRIDEAMHPLTLLATGMYGRALPNQNGAPLRLVVPWKYGFKGIKSIVKIEFTQKMPPTAWNVSAPEEYGFYSNVNPSVDHPRWSQKTERRISGTASKLFAERIETRPFNGYAAQVASMYSGMDLRKWF